MARMIRIASQAASRAANTIPAQQIAAIVTKTTESTLGARANRVSRANPSAGMCHRCKIASERRIRFAPTPLTPTIR